MSTAHHGFSRDHAVYFEDYHKISRAGHLDLVLHFCRFVLKTWRNGRLETWWLEWRVGTWWGGLALILAYASSPFRQVFEARQSILHVPGFRKNNWRFDFAAKRRVDSRNIETTSLSQDGSN